jgi:hypothetical protein
MVGSSVPDQAKNMIQPAYDFVVAEEKRLISQGNPEPIEGYSRFRCYFESGLALLGLEATKLCP